MNAADTKPCRHDELRRIGGWLPTFSSIRRRIRDGAGLAALMNRNGQPIKPLSSPVRQAIYAALCELADKHPDLGFRASHATIAAEAGVSERAVLQGIQELTALGVIAYTPGEHHQPNTYRLNLPNEISGLTPQRLPVEAVSTAEFAPLNIASTANAAVSAPQISPSSTAEFAAKQQDPVNQDFVKDNNSLREGGSENVVVAALVSVGMQQHTAQQLFQQYDASRLLEAAENTKRAMKRGNVTNPAGYARSEIKRLEGKAKEIAQSEPLPPPGTVSSSVTSPAADGPTRASTASQRPSTAVSRMETGAVSNEADNLGAFKEMRQRLHEEKGLRETYQAVPPKASMPVPSSAALKDTLSGQPESGTHAGRLPTAASASCAEPPRSAPGGGIDTYAVRSADCRAGSDTARGVYEPPSRSPGRLDLQRQRACRRGGELTLLAASASKGAPGQRTRSLSEGHHTHRFQQPAAAP